ncbi:adenine-specific methyltransferase EcoRI family protein [Treponema sp. R80B11-R83G3]
MAKSKEKQYIYIVQALLEPSKCKIGKTNDLNRRLKEYNSMTGKSKENIYQYLLTCEVKDMATVENDLKYEFITLREEKSKEIYFFNTHWFNQYVKFIKSHPLFIKETYLKTEDKKQIVKIVKRTTPSLEERGVTRKELLQKAQKINNDEFYTRLEDVEKELSKYNKNIWNNKTVFCNCDDAVDDSEKNTSAFSIYFIQNFRELGLKKLICTHYSGTVDLFNQGAKGYIFTKTGYKEFGKKEFPEDYNGSFDHPLSIKILKEEADIVCTNPPFSKAIDYWELIIKSGKRFLIISAQTNYVTMAYMSYFKEKKAWGGYNRVDWFLNPKKEIVSNPCFWYTNIKIKNRPRYKHLKIVPLKEIPEKYIKYDDSGYLQVDNCYIPSDYKKPFAVSNHPLFNGLLEKGYKIIDCYVPKIKNKDKFRRVLVQKE